MKMLFVRNCDNIARSHAYSHKTSRAHVAILRTPAHRTRDLLIYRDPSDPWSPQRSSAHTDSLLSTHRLGRLEPRTAQGTRQSAVRVRAQQRGQAHRRRVRWNLRCPKCRAAAHIIQTCESRAGVSGMSVARGRRPPSSGGCTCLRGIKVVRWPRIQRSEVALQPTGGHASGGTSVRRRSRVAHHRGDTPDA